MKANQIVFLETEVGAFVESRHTGFNNIFSTHICCREVNDRITVHDGLGWTSKNETTAYSL
jgi:hypothetical protein